MAETRGSIVCRLCANGIVVSFHRLHGNGVHLAVADVAPLREHYAACTGVHPGEQPAPSKAMVAPEPEVPAQPVAQVAPVAVRLVDERMSTMTADSHLRASGMAGTNKQSGKKRRAVIDQAAATVILQSALDAERTRNEPPGEGMS